MNFEQLISEYKNEMLTTLKELVSINSTYDETSISKNKPYGEGVYKALQYVANLGKKYGFEVDYCDGYATELTIGKGKKLISIFAHMDVVPATGEWSSDPFLLTQKNGKLIGRGSSDDKGPFVSSFFATLALYKAHLIDDYRVRIVVGGDEERGSSCLIYYFETLKKEAPTYGFTPDSSFPLIYGEKNIAEFYPTLNIKIKNVKSINGGLVPNAVCDKCEVVLEKEDLDFIKYLKNKNIEHVYKDNKVTFIGKSSHGSMPELGKNAALISLAVLGDFYRIEKIKILGEKLQDGSGKAFDCYNNSKLLKETTYCTGIISYKNNTLKLTINFRFGEEVNYEEYVHKFDKYFDVKSTLDNEISPSLLYKPDSFLVKTLLNAYQSETNDYAEHEMVTGGGTYAKHAPNTIAFGAEFPGEETKMHEPDEFIRIDHLYKAAQIYARAIYDLGKSHEN